MSAIAIDDIERWRSVYIACEKAGLLTKDGTLRHPECWWDDDGESCGDPFECSDYFVGDIRHLRPAWGGRECWWVKTDDGDREFGTHEEAKAFAALLPKEDE